jgi:heme exporter protein A
MYHLQVKQLSCIRETRLLFKNISFSLYPRNLLLIEGPNGAGKSSLLRLLSGIATPVAGQVYWCGQPIHSDNTEYRNLLHYIGHANGIKLGLTVIENLSLIACLSTAAPVNSIKQVVSILSLLKLHAHQHTLARCLSAGQKRRLALAKLLLIPKILWILDEPFTALDSHIQMTLRQHIEKHLLHGGMCVLSTHHSLSFEQIMPQKLWLG